MNKRGQAALEFLMTYGWAILVVMVIIGALAYFGVLNPTMFVPERCSLGSGLVCDTFLLSHRADTTNITIRLENSLGRDITLLDFNITYDADNIGCEWEEPYSNDDGEFEIIRSGSFFDIILDEHMGSIIGDSCDLEDHIGRKIQMDLTMRYYPTDAGIGFTQVRTGSIIATVQS